MTLVAFEGGEILGTIEHVEQQDLSRADVRDSLVNAIENFLAIDAEIISFTPNAAVASA